jgi:hypothetical protein
MAKGEETILLRVQAEGATACHGPESCALIGSLVSPDELRMGLRVVSKTIRFREKAVSAYAKDIGAEGKLFDPFTSEFNSGGGKRGVAGNLRLSSRAG